MKLATNVFGMSWIDSDFWLLESNGFCSWFTPALVPGSAESALVMSLDQVYDTCVFRPSWKRRSTDAMSAS